MSIKNSTRHRKLLAATLTGGLALSQFSGIISSSTVSQAKSMDAANIPCMITRVDETGENGLIHSHFEDPSGQVYTDSDTSLSSTKDSIPLASIRNPRRESSLPDRLDLREQGLVTPIKDQGVTGCCWAFSTIKAIESNCIKNGLLPVDNIDFSENHLTWFSYHPADSRSDLAGGDGIMSTGGDIILTPNPFAYGAISGTAPYDTGGSAILANFTLAKWAGTELESNAPFTAQTLAEEVNMASVMEHKGQTLYHSSAHLQNVFNYDNYSITDQYYYNTPGIISTMKQAILDHGAMSVSLYYDKYFLQTTENGSAYYQNQYTGNDGVKNANHSVTIVGWDDSYSRNNFSQKPSGDGAWLIANSYGTEFGDTGYFWLSYYDLSICDCASFLMEPADNYDHIYQYDGFGWGTANYSTTQNLKAANIFTADSSAAQQLRAVSFYTLTDGQRYNIQVYRGVDSSPTDGTRIDTCTTEGTATQNGYHTVQLKEPVNIAAGEKFSVVVTYLRDGKETVYVPVEGGGATDPSSALSIGYSSRTGQSFLYTKVLNASGSSSTKWVDTSSLGHNNVCVKAFTNDTQKADPLPTVKQTIRLGKGETYQLSGNYSKFASSDDLLATVSRSGKITAKKVGTTAILATRGSNSHLVRIQIMKAPSKVTLEPSGRKKMKKGKHLTLKTVLPSGSASHKITFRSTQPKVAKVSQSGKVTAKKLGRASIIVRTYNGRTAKLQITVNSNK